MSAIDRCHPALAQLPLAFLMGSIAFDEANSLMIRPRSTPAPAAAPVRAAVATGRASPPPKPAASPPPAAAGFVFSGEWGWLPVVAVAVIRALIVALAK